MEKLNKQITPGGKKKQLGISLMDFVLWMPLVTIAGIAIVNMYASGSSASASTQVSRELAGIRAGANISRGVAADYTGITIATLSAAKALPTTVSVAGQSSLSGATYTLDTTTAPATAAMPGIKIVMPTDVCTKVAASIDGTWAQVNAVTTLPLTKAQITTACANSATTGITAYFTN